MSAQIIELHTMKPLFIPLKREFWEAFRDGKKTVEYRIYGPRWNRKTCAIGRPVVLSLGYGKAHRLKGMVISAEPDFVIPFSDDWIKCYGWHPGPAIAIRISIRRPDAEFDPRKCEKLHFLKVKSKVHKCCVLKHGFMLKHWRCDKKEPYCKRK